MGSLELGATEARGVWRWGVWSWVSGGGEYGGRAVEVRVWRQGYGGGGSRVEK